jgi:hypothetical protein
MPADETSTRRTQAGHDLPAHVTTRYMRQLVDQHHAPFSRRPMAAIRGQQDIGMPPTDADRDFAFAADGNARWTTGAKLHRDFIAEFLPRRVVRQTRIPA